MGRGASSCRSRTGPSPIGGPHDHPYLYPDLLLRLQRPLPPHTPRPPAQAHAFSAGAQPVAAVVVPGEWMWDIPTPAGRLELPVEFAAVVVAVVVVVIVVAAMTVVAAVVVVAAAVAASAAVAVAASEAVAVVAR